MSRRLLHSLLTESPPNSIAHTIQRAHRRYITTPTIKSAPLPKSFFTSKRPNPTRTQFSRRFFSASQTCRNTASTTTQPALSLKERMKKLGREYGWSAFGVYMALSALDFPFCYLLVRTLGTDRIGRWEETAMFYVKKLIPDAIETWWHDMRASMKSAEKDFTGKETVNDAAEMATWGVEEADAKAKKDASLGTQLALAYAIHKSFIFVRVPLTAAVTPKVVKVLRSWGWDIGKKTTKAAKAAKRAELQKPL